MRYFFIIIFLIQSLGLFGQVESEIDSLEFGEYYKQFQKDSILLDSIYSPLYKSGNKYFTICSNGDETEYEPFAGYILKNVDFNKTDTIYVTDLLPFELSKGKKEVLFLHLQPGSWTEFKDCDSTNIVIITEIELPKTQSQDNISENTQLGFYTGVWYYPFEQKVFGTIEILKIEENIWKVKLDLRFEFDNDLYRLIKADFHISSLRGKDISKMNKSG